MPSTNDTLGMSRFKHVFLCKCLVCCVWHPGRKWREGIRAGSHGLKLAATEGQTAARESRTPRGAPPRSGQAELERGFVQDRGGPSNAHPLSTLRIRLQAESCPVKLEMPRSWQWPENPGDMAWRRRKSWGFYPRNLVLKTG